MEKVEYGDINKFLVSIGLVLIALSLLTPYYFLKEDFGIFLESKTVALMAAKARMIIAQRSDQVSIIQTSMPIISLVLFGTGALIMGIGLRRWFGRQALIDRKFDMEVEKLSLELKIMTPSQTIEKAIQEVDEIAASSSPIEKPVASQEMYLDYLKVEEELLSKFQNYESPNFDFSEHVKIGGKFELDLLGRARTNKYVDRILEIKFFNDEINIYLLQKTIVRLAEVITYYKHQTNRTAIPVLVVIHSEASIPENISIQLFKYASELDGSQDQLKRLKIRFVNKDSIHDFNVKTILEK